MEENTNNNLNNNLNNNQLDNSINQFNNLIPFHRLTIYNNKLSFCVLANLQNGKLIDMTTKICDNDLDNFDNLKIVCICKKGRVLFEKKPISVKLKVNNEPKIINGIANFFKYKCDVCNAASCERCYYLLKDMKGCQFCKKEVSLSISHFITIRKEIEELKQKITKLEIMVNDLIK